MLLVVIFILLCPLFGANVLYYPGSQAITESTTQNTVSPGFPEISRKNFSLW